MPIAIYFFETCQLQLWLHLYGIFYLEVSKQLPIINFSNLSEK